MGGKIDGHDRGPQGHFYAVPVRVEAEASNSVITNTILICSRLLKLSLI